MAITIGQAILWFKGSTDDLEQKIGSAKGMIDAFSRQMQKTLADVEKNFSDATKQQVALETAAFSQRITNLAKKAKAEEEVNALLIKSNAERVKAIAIETASTKTDAEKSVAIKNINADYDKQIVKIKASSIASEEYQKKIAQLTSKYEANIAKITEAEKSEKAKAATEQAAATRNLGLLQLEAKAMDKAIDAKKIKDGTDAWKKHGDAIKAVGDKLAQVGKWMAVAGTAMTATFGFLIKGAAEGEESNAMLARAIKNRGNTTTEVGLEEIEITKQAAEAKKKIDEDAAESVKKTNESISESLQTLADKAAETTKDFSEKLVEDERKLQETLLKSQQDYQDKSADAEKKYTETLASLRQEANDLDQEYADNRDERIRSLNESLGAVDQKYAAQRSAIESQMASASTAQSKAALQRQLDKLGGNQQNEKDKIQSEFDLKEKQEQDAYQKSQQRLNDKINKENRAYQDQTAKMKAEQEKRESDAAKSYEKETEKLREEYAKRQAELDKDRAKIEQKRVEDEEAFQKKMERENKSYENQYSAIERGVVKVAKKKELTAKEQEEMLKRLEAQAEKIAETSVFDDDDIKRVEMFAVSVNGISEETIPRLLQVSADVAAANETNIKDAGIALTKALENPEKAAKKLTALNVILTKEQTEAIKNLMHEGNLVKAQQVILDASGEKFKGMAQAQRDTLGGNIKAFIRDIGELDKSLGGLFGSSFKEIIKKLDGFVLKFKNWIDLHPEFTKEIKKLVDGGLKLLGGLFEGLGNALGGIGDYFEKHPDQFAKIATFLALAGPALVAIGGAFATLKGLALLSWINGLMGASTVAATGGTAAVAGTGLLGLLGVLLAIVGTAGIGWEIGRWIDETTANNAFGQWIDGMMDKLVAFTDKLTALRDKLNTMTGGSSDMGWIQTALRWNPMTAGVTRAYEQYQGQYADGGIVSKSGLQLVGERGPELVRLSAGSKVYTNSETQGMLSTKNVSMSITIPGMIVRETADIDKLSCALADKVSRKLRQRGLATI